MSEFLTTQKERISRELADLERRATEELARRADEGAETELGVAEDLRADVSERIDETALARSGLEEQLRVYRRAMERIEEGTYETCERCGKQISEDRLEISPTATLCIDCQRELEREQGQR